MATAHLICGLPCAGKTTYAIGLRADTNGVLFSLDRWLITLFGRYSLAAVGHNEHTARVLACRELTWESAAELLRRSVDVILDDGFFLRLNRMRYVEMATAAGATTKIHYLDAPASVLRQRLAERNAKLPPHNFRIDPETLHGFVSLFEPPSADEGAELVVVRASDSPAAPISSFENNA
jgi:predicted kinase